jgi:F-type H+-transporting ATPase subunit b
VQQLVSAGGVLSAAAKKTVNPIIPNGTFIVELIAFFLILWFLAKKVVPLISSSMAKRQELIRSQIDDSKAAKERLEAAEAEYKQAVADTRTDAARIREEARVQGQQIIEEMSAQAQETAARIREANQARLETEHQLLLVQLRSELGELAVELASRIIGHELSGDARQRQLVDDFINTLDSGPAGDSRESAPTAPSVAGS